MADQSRVCFDLRVQELLQYRLGRSRVGREEFDASIYVEFRVVRAAFDQSLQVLFMLGHYTQKHYKVLKILDIVFRMAIC